MAYYPDLSFLGVFGAEVAPRLRAVGWLEPGHEYQRGEVPAEVLERLVELLSDPWQPCVTPGAHSCGWCRYSGGPTTFSLRGSARSIRMGASNLFVPGEGVMYVMPSLALHYMDAHEYAPPEEFREAVLRCPPMRSMEYLRVVLRHGLAGPRFPARDG